MERGYGVAAAIDANMISPLAAAAERAGFTTFWVNDTEAGNGLEQLRRAQEATERIRLGVGVLAVDRWSAEQIVTELDRLRLDQTRLDLGIGAGQLHAGSLEAVREVAEGLRSKSTARVLIGALGPRMVALGGEAADGVVLSWLTPTSAQTLAGVVRDAASASGRPAPRVVAYARTASNPDAFGRLERESATYESYPAYKRHFDRLGVRAIDTTARGSASEIDAFLNQFANSIDEVVCRAIPASETLDGYLEVLTAAAPVPA